MVESLPTLRKFPFYLRNQRQDDHRWDLYPWEGGLFHQSEREVLRNINYITPSSQDNHPATKNNDTDSSLTNSEDEQHGNGNGALNARTENGRPRLQHSTGLSHDPVETEFRMSLTSHKVYTNVEKRGQLMDNMFRLNEREGNGRSREMHFDILLKKDGDQVKARK